MNNITTTRCRYFSSSVSAGLVSSLTRKPVGFYWRLTSQVQHVPLLCRIWGSSLTGSAARIHVAKTKVIKLKCGSGANTGNSRSFSTIRALTSNVHEFRPRRDTQIPSFNSSVQLIAQQLTYGNVVKYVGTWTRQYVSTKYPLLRFLFIYLFHQSHTGSGFCLHSFSLWEGTLKTIQSSKREACERDSVPVSCATSEQRCWGAHRRKHGKETENKHLLTACFFSSLRKHSKHRRKCYLTRF